jgi:hypothetical protein
MPKPTKTEQERGFIRSFWDELREIEADFMGIAQVFEYTSKRPGVLEIALAFDKEIGPDDEPMGRQMYKYEFPNSSNQTYAASKWIAARALRQMVEEAVSKRPVRKKKGV